MQRQGPNYLTRQGPNHLTIYIFLVSFAVTRF